MDNDRKIGNNIRCLRIDYKMFLQLFRRMISGLPPDSDLKYLIDRPKEKGFDLFISSKHYDDLEEGDNIPVMSLKPVNFKIKAVLDDEDDDEKKR